MLSQENLDAIVICTPSGCILDNIIAAEHGVNVISEKPMATRFEDGLAMVRACDEAGVRLLIVKQEPEKCYASTFKTSSF